jgi:pyruvate dehydrogenase E1 component alpha subunit
MKFSKQDLIKLYTNLVRTRAFDELFTRRLGQGKLLGFYHPASGGEAPGVGGCTFLKKDDVIWPHHRGHAIPHMIAKGVDVKYFLAEHVGKVTGACGGMSTFHGFDPENGFFGTSGLIGSCFPISVGYGLAAKKNATGQVVVCFFGDGGSNRGTLHEAFLTANNWDLPVVYVCENNRVAQFVPFEDSFPVENVADLAQGYGMPGVVVDGQDVIAVAEAVMAAVERARKGKGPSLIECKTCRYCAHFVSAPDMFGCDVRSEEEIEALKERDPIDMCRENLLARKFLTKKEIQRIDEEVALEIEAAEKFADESPLPDPQTFARQLYAS